MGSSERNFSVQQWLSKFGYTYNANDPFADIYKTVSARNVPPGITPGQFTEDFKQLCEACLRARAILYYKENPGDCGTATPVPGGGLVQGLKLGSLGLSTATKIAGLAGLASTTLGAVTAGIGLVLGPIISIFTHHAQAVANEQATLCQVSSAATPYIQGIDKEFFSGQETAADAIAAMRTLAQQLIQGLASISNASAIKCDAACYYQGIMAAHADFAQYYYGQKTSLLKLSGTWIIIGLLVFLVLIFFLWKGRK
jgi:hypothetical protein